MPESMPAFAGRKAKQSRAHHSRSRRLRLSLRWLKEPGADGSYAESMKISDITCRECGAFYQMAESVSAKGSRGQARCALCGDLLAEWNDGRLKAVRLVMSPQHRYAHIPVPPVSDVFR